jgi:2,4-didehydro-3-deoxy-L-rhamnonate hydrolase
MKLVRWGPAGEEQPGLIDDKGRLRDLSFVIRDVLPDQLDPISLDILRSVEPETLPAVEGEPRLGPPLAGIGKIVCIGLNYRDHAAEVGSPLPTEPQIFLKATSALAGPDDPIPRPTGARKLDHEVELALVIGTTARNVREADAMRHVAGYTLLNDVSERAFQMEHGGGTTKGKSADGFAPLGPWLVTADEVRDPADLRLWCRVDGETRQDGTTRDLVFGPAALVAYLSRFMSLRPGDLISTGTPAGVGHGRKPPVYLEPGQTVEIGADGLGRQRCRVVEAD